MEDKPNVYQLISAVSAELAKEGIAKEGYNKQGEGYRFRGIDDIYNCVGPIMADKGLVILTRCVSREYVERTSSRGNALIYVTVKAEFDFISSFDGSKHTVVTYGEAMDSGDKATNKAMSAAFKYAIIQGFCIPTKVDNDADASTHEVMPKRPAANFKTRDPNPINPISKEQADIIRSMAIEVGAEESRIAAFYQSNSIESIPADAYSSVIKALEKKRATLITTANTALFTDTAEAHNG